MNREFNLFNSMTKFYYTIFNLVALAAIIYVGIDTSYGVLQMRVRPEDTERSRMPVSTEQKENPNPGLSDFQSIIDRNIFSTSKRTDIGAESNKIESLEPTTLKIALIGTIAGDQRYAAAIIEETGKRKQALYRVGDSVQEAVVKAILRGKVVLRVGDKDEILIMEEPSSSGRDQGPQGAIRPAGREAGLAAFAPLTRTITVRRSDVEEALADIDNLMTQASIRPHITEGEADGLAITGIKAGSIFRKMGLRNGDIVLGVNDQEIRSPDDLISLYNDLKSFESDTSLQIKRRGRERTLNFRFRD